MRIAFLTICLTTLFSACTVTSQQINVEVLIPSTEKVDISPEDRIMVVANYRPKSKFYQGRTSAYVDDSVQIIATANAFADNFRTVGYFTEAYVPIKALEIEGKEQNELTPEQIKNFSILDKPRYIVDISLLRTLVSPIDSYTYKAVFASLWRVYDAETCSPKVEIVYKDSLYYDQFQRVDRELFDSTVAEDVVEKVSQRLSNALFPHWEQESRYYMTTEEYTFKQVVSLINQFKWKEVIDYMQPYLSTGDKNDAFAASFNIALACEMSGNFDLALKWLDKCEKIRKTNETMIYRAILADRIEKEKTLQNQAAEQ